jgi:hypothetical protein
MMNAILQPRSRLERVGFWLIVAAAGLLVLVLAGVVLGPVLRAFGLALVMAAFVGFVTALNSRTLAAEANRVLGRRIFPIVNVDDVAVIRLARANSLLTFAFTFVLTILPFGAIVSAFVIVAAFAIAVYGLPRLRALRRSRTTITAVPTGSYSAEPGAKDQAA